MGLAAAGMLAILAGPETMAQEFDEGPVVVGAQRQQFRDFEIDRFDSSLEFYSRYQNDKIEQNGATTRTDSELLFRETVGISTRAFIGHRNLIDLTADASLGFEDNFIDSDTQGLRDEHESELFSQFDINALILGKGPAPLTVFARRHESLLERAFAGSIDSETSEFGASVQLFAETVPTTLRYSHRIENLSDQLGIVDDDRVEDTITALSIWAPAPGHRVTLDYDLDFVDEKRSNSQTNFTRHNGILTHEWDFGEKDEHDLRSSLLVREQTGDFEESTLRLNEALTLNHSDTLRTRYNLTLEDREVSGQVQRLAQGRATIRHELFDSLVTTASIGASRVDLPNDNFTRDEYDGAFGLEYTKRVPFGRLDASAALAGLRVDESERGSIIRIFDAPRVLNSGVPALLIGNTILEDSIVISDLSGSIFYVDGLDYSSTAFTDRVELLRIITGSIFENQTVLVDYSLGPDEAATIETYTSSFAARYTIDEGALTGFSPYAEYSDTSQTIDPVGSRLPIESTMLRYGVDYRLGQLTFNVEQEDRDSTVSPFDALRASARFDQRLGLNSYVTVNFSHENFDFRDDRGEIKLNRAFAEGVQQVASGLDLRLRLLYRLEEDTVAGDTEGFEQALELNWRKRQTTMFLSVRNSILESDDAQTESQTITFGLTRQF